MRKPSDVNYAMRRLRTVYVDGQWRTAELTKKEAALLTAIGVDLRESLGFYGLLVTFK